MYLSDIHTHSIASGHGTNCTISDMAKEAGRKGGASTLARNKNYYKPQKCGLFYVKFYLFLCCTELYFIFICDIMRYETQL